MSGKTKAPAKKASPKATAKKATKPVKAAKVEASACAKGGKHEWEQEDGGTYCKKCHETKPNGGGKKPAAKAADAKPDKSGNGQRKKANPTENGKLSAIDAAAKVLDESKEPMNTRGMIEAMSKKRYWTSPGGATPWATLYSAILNEITTKGKESRFKKTDRGHFALNK